jgi:DNA-binding GntR family transcriptional regulator
LINKYSNIPLYSQLKNIIIKNIEEGEYPEDSKIPSEQELCELYKISRPTVRQAISELTNNGFLYKEKGKGTFVSKKKSIIDIKNYTGFTDSILDSSIPGERDIISLSTIKSKEFLKLEDAFKIPYNQEAEFAEVKYLTKQNNEVLSYNTSYLPLNLFPSIIKGIELKKPSYDILVGKYPFLPVKSRSTLEVVYTEHKDAQHLQVQLGQALIQITNTLLSKSGQTVEYIISKYRADKSKLVFENSK